MKGLRKKINQLVKKEEVWLTDADGKEWVKVSDNRFIPKDKLTQISEHDLAKQGYQMFEADDDVYYTDADDDGLPQFFHDLIQEIDKDKSGDISSQEIVTAYKNKATSETLEKMIVKSPSEWSPSSVVKSYFNPFLSSPITEEKAIAEHELERIANLQWMDKATAQGLAIGPKVWHMHPFGVLWELGNPQLITKGMLKAVAPDKVNDIELLNALNKYCPLYEINTPLRIAHFLAQTAHESGGFSKFGEGTSYKLENALGTWPSRKTAIRAISIENGYLKQPDLFNSVYGTRNGNVAGTNDGYNFRGRGIIQLTGRTNYTNYNTSHNTKNPDDIQDFINNPDLVKTDMEYAVESACWYWTKQGAVRFKDINILADMGTGTGIINAVGAAVNGWSQRSTQIDSRYIYLSPKVYVKQPNGHEDRVTKFNAIKKCLGL